jgi:hypothetical protein
VEERELGAPVEMVSLLEFHLVAWEMSELVPVVLPTFGSMTTSRMTTKLGDDIVRLSIVIC